MIPSQFWTLFKTTPGKRLPGPVLQLQDISILELTEDGLAYLWPERPDRTGRCLYCKRFPACQSDPQSNRPAFVLFMIKSVLCAGDNAPAGRQPKFPLLEQTPAALLMRLADEERRANPDSCKLSLMLRHMLALKEGRETLDAALKELGCQPPANNLYPCNFIEDPNTTHQDLDAYMLDGESEHAGGSFKNLDDFLICHQYSKEDVKAVELGTFQSICTAREAWAIRKAEN